MTSSGIIAFLMIFSSLFIVVDYYVMIKAKNKVNVMIYTGGIYAFVIMISDFLIFTKFIDQIGLLSALVILILTTAVLVCIELFNAIQVMKAKRNNDDDKESIIKDSKDDENDKLIR